MNKKASFKVHGHLGMLYNLYFNANLRREAYYILGIIEGDSPQPVGTDCDTREFELFYPNYEDLRKRDIRIYHAQKPTKEQTAHLKKQRASVSKEVLADIDKHLEGLAKIYKHEIDSGPKIAPNKGAEYEMIQAFINGSIYESWDLYEPEEPSTTVPPEILATLDATQEKAPF